MNSQYKQNGYHLIQNALSEHEVTSLIKEMSIFNNEINNYGIRNLMDKVPYVKKLAMSSPILQIAKEVLGEQAKPIRSVFFDKVPEANWNVAWHQDTSIVVKEKIEMPGFNKWREKEGVPHVEPPEKYLSSILTLRIHLDPTNEKNGVLRVVSGSHRDGRVKSGKLMAIVENSEIINCNANPGDILLMSPLLFHSSRKAIEPKHRRIIHLEYSAMKLPEPMQWYEN